MPVQLAQLAELGRRDLQKGVKLWDPSSVPSVVDRMVGETITDTQSFIRMATYTGPDLPQQRDPGQAPPETDYRQKATKNFSATKNIIKVRVDDETMKDNQYRDKMLQFGKDLRHNDQVKREIDGVNAFFNFANVTTKISTIGGEAVASSTHSLSAEAAFNYGATTYSNVIATPATPSPSLLITARKQFVLEVNDKGFLDAPMGNFNVFCHPTWTIIWQMILQSSTVYGQVDQPTNKPIQAFTGTVVEVARATHEGWTMFQTRERMKNPLFVWERNKFSLSPENGMQYEDNDTWWVLAKSRRVFGAKDYRGLVFNLLGS